MLPFFKEAHLTVALNAKHAVRLGFLKYLSHWTFNLQTKVEALNGSLSLVPGLSYESATLPAVCLQALILRSAYVALKTGLKNRAAPAPGLLASSLA